MMGRERGRFICVGKDGMGGRGMVGAFLEVSKQRDASFLCLTLDKTSFNLSKLRCLARESQKVAFLFTRELDVSGGINRKRTHLAAPQQAPL